MKNEETLSLALTVMLCSLIVLKNVLHSKRFPIDQNKVHSDKWIYKFKDIWHDFVMFQSLRGCISLFCIFFFIDWTSFQIASQKMFGINEWRREGKKATNIKWMIMTVLVKTTHNDVTTTNFNLICDACIANQVRKHISSTKLNCSLNFGNDS